MILKPKAPRGFAKTKTSAIGSPKELCLFSTLNVWPLIVIVVENYLLVAIKTEHKHTFRPSNSTFRYIPTETQNTLT